MDNIKSYNYTLRANDFDMNKRLLPSAVLSLFQDVAGRHANELGVGFDEMVKRSILWVIVRARFEILKTPELYSRVKITTWPLPPSRAACRRDYLIENEKGELLVRGSTDWVFMHSDERRLVSATDVYPLEQFCKDKAFEDKNAKLHDFDPGSGEHTVNIGYSCLDVNRHVNNTKYADFALDAIHPTDVEALKLFQIDFRKEVRADESLSVLTRRNEGEILAKGIGEDGNVRFICRMVTK